MKKAKNPLYRFALSRDFIAYCKDSDCFVNLAGSYDYLEVPYYASQELELAGKKVFPTCEEMLDAYITPLFLEKAKLSQLPAPEYYITNGYFEPPVIVDTANPFMLRSRIVLKASLQHKVAKSMTRNYTYAICCQELPPGSQVKYFRSVMGWCSFQRFRELSKQIFDVFHIPLARVRVIIHADGQMLLSDVGPLPFESLNRHELDYIEKRIEWVE